MPTYDYKCNACDHRFEAFQSIKAGALKKCPECGKNALERLIGTGGAVLFKGSGFYQTDYRSKEYTEAAKKDAPAESKGESKDKPSAGEAASSGKGASEGGSSSTPNAGSSASAAKPAEKPADKKAS